MPRALAYAHHKVPRESRSAAEQFWRERREKLAARGCHYWIFQSPIDDTKFLEFIEARDAATLADAGRDAGLEPSAPIYLEVELS